MSYPVLSLSRTEAYVQSRRNNSSHDGPPQHELRGPEDDCYDEIIEETLKVVMDRWASTDPYNVRTSDKGGITGELAVMLYEGFRELPGRILSDRDFWRYCAAYLYDLVEWRIGGQNVSLTNYGASSDSVRDCLPHDMFQQAHIAYLAGKASGDADPFALAKLNKVIDVWRSHILRVLIGNAPLVARELLINVEADRLGREVRQVAKNLSRARANLLFELLDQAQVRELVDREIAREDP